MEGNKNKMNKIIEYFKSLVTTINLELNTPIPDHHSY